MATIKINGQNFEVDGNNINIQSRNGTITINEKTSLEGASGNVKIELPKDVTVGSVTADGSVECGNVQGDVNAGSSITCGNVGLCIDAGGSINCGDVGTSVISGGSVNCGTVQGHIEAGGSVNVKKITI